MIITNLIGGLGNQMFQYACGRALALNLQQELRFSTDQFANYRLHQGLMLETAFDLNLLVASSANLRDLLGPVRSNPFARRLLARWSLPKGSNFLAEPADGSYIELSSAEVRGAYLHGYWQRECYFESQANVIRADFTWRRPLEGQNLWLAQAIQREPHSVSLHVRRGDYISSTKNQTIYAVCSADYYTSALNYLSRLGILKIFAFSDDPAWVRDVLSPKYPGLTIVDHNRGRDSAFDMQLMSLFRHHIIANSSFSWWGAWLDARSDKLVFAPKKWFSDKRDCSGLVPPSWYRI